MKILCLILMSGLIGLSGCTHLKSLSTSSVPSNRSHPVKAEAYKFIFLALNFDNDYVNGMAVDLANQCPKGRVEGILTKHESIVYVPLFAHASQVTAEGYCVSKSSNKRRSRK